MQRQASMISCLANSCQVPGAPAWQLFAPRHPPDQPPLSNLALQVVCAVGASESELGDLSAPRRVDGEGATRLVEAATGAGVQQFVLVTSLGTGKLGFPAGVLNLFGGVLTFKRKAEEALEASGMPYVIVRPGGLFWLWGVLWCLGWVGGGALGPFGASHVS